MRSGKEDDDLEEEAEGRSETYFRKLTPSLRRGGELENKNYGLQHIYIYISLSLYVYIMFESG